MKIKLSSSLRWMCPVDVPNLIRLGRNGDGGYILPKSIVESSDGLLSFGMGRDWSFEEDYHVLKPTNPIHMYDGTVDRIMDYIRDRCNKFYVDQKVLHKENVTTYNFDLSIERINRNNLILKCDIEGDEYNLVENILSNKHRITAIVMEFHWLHEDRQQFNDALQKLMLSYKIVHFHGNNNSWIGTDGLPKFLEVTLVRNDLIQSSDSRTSVWLQNLDFPNRSELEEYEYFFENIA